MYNPFTYTIHKVLGEQEKHWNELCGQVAGKQFTGIQWEKKSWVESWKGKNTQDR